MTGRRWLVGILLVPLLVRAGVLRAQQGIVLGAVGAVNQSMGGAAVAAPLDALGATNWNPATIGGLSGTELDFSFALFYPQSRLTTTIHAGAFAPFLPASTPLEESTPSDAKVAPLISSALVYQPAASPWTFGISAIQIAGSELNYPGDPRNAVLAPPPPHGTGLGPITSTFDILQFAATAACLLTDRLSVGLAPTLDLGLLVAEPALFARPDDASGDGFPTYPSAGRPLFTWGAGVQAGLYYTTDIGWNFGASYKSPQWFEPFQWHATDQIGRPRLLTYRLDYPAIYSLGTAYRGFEHWLLALDLRYIDYKDTRGFGPSGFARDGAVLGLGWDNIFVVDLGIQYQASEALSLRAGYSFNQEPITSAQASFNIASPAVIEHALSVGASYKLNAGLSIALAYTHAFANSISGPAILPFTTLPFVTLKSDASADYLLFSANLRF